MKFFPDKKVLHSPNLAPRDFWLFPNLRLEHIGERFALIEEDIKVNAIATLKAILLEGHRRSFQQLQTRLCGITIVERIFVILFVWRENIKLI